MITYDLSGKVAIVTGASQGIGTGIAAALAQAGADLVMSARTPDVLEAAAAEVRALGVRVLTVPADVTKAADIEELDAARPR